MGISWQEFLLFAAFGALAGSLTQLFFRWRAERKIKRALEIEASYTVPASDEEEAAIDAAVFDAETQPTRKPISERRQSSRPRK